MVFSHSVKDELFVLTQGGRNAIRNRGIAVGSVNADSCNCNGIGDFQSPVSSQICTSSEYSMR